jgi:6-pyruvoyltetrahydropterin/6-carboxytetrahydropterin synthase
MYTVTETIHFCYGHRLLHYDGGCGHVHGHNGRAEITLSSGDLDGRGMVEDFDRIGLVAKAWIDENLDHRMVLHREDPLVDLLREAGEPLFLMDVNPTAEAIARLIYDAARERGLPVSEVRFWETERSVAAWRPDD